MLSVLVFYEIAYQLHIVFLQKIFIVLGLTISCVLSESAQDQSNSRFFGGIFGNIFGNGNNNQIGGDGSKPGSCSVSENITKIPPKNGELL